MPRFFGEFLIATGEIDNPRLQEALGLCHQVNLRLGDLAIRESWMNEEQIEEVLKRQRSVDRRFGEIAVAMEYLTESQLQTLVHQRSASHLYIGEALVQLDYLTRSSLEELLDQYKAEVASFAEQNQAPVEISRIRIAALTLEALPRICSRMARLQTLNRWGPEWFDDPTLANRRWLAVEGGDHLVIGIAASDQLAEQIAAAMLMCELDELQTGDVDDALGEFLNLVVGSAKNKAAEDGDQFRLSPTLTDNFPTEGFGLYLVTNHGPCCVVFQTVPPSE